MNGWLSNWHIKHSNQVVISPYIVDLLLPDFNAIIEVDDATIKYDLKRTQFLTHSGYRVLRFRNEELRDRTAVKAKLDDFLYA